MKNISFILLFCLVTFQLHTQNVIQEGKWRAVQGDSIGLNRTSMHKAQGDAVKMYKANQNDPIYILPPTRYRVEFDELEDQNIHQLTMISDVYVDNVASTSAQVIIDIEGEFSYMQIKLREFGTKNWQFTNKSNINVISATPLKSRTEYEYMVMVESTTGQKLFSDIKTFKTL